LLSGTYIFFNIWKFHHDPDFFPDPWLFKPERFLSIDGRSIVPNEHLVPFGLGKRKCMGESLAKAEIFLFFTILVQTLKVSLPINRNPPSEDDYESTLLRSPNPFFVHLAARQ
jgi:cytochrome P450